MTRHHSAKSSQAFYNSWFKPHGCIFSHIFTSQLGEPIRPWRQMRSCQLPVIDTYAHYQAYAIVARARCDSVENTATSFDMPTVPPLTWPPPSTFMSYI